MGWLMEMALGVCLIILCGGAVNAINTHVKKKPKQAEAGRGMGKEGDVEGIDARLTEIERRMTDVQDVMIALSEKFDRWEEKKTEF
jgi:hypothetical protein